MSWDVLRLTVEEQVPVSSCFIFEVPVNLQFNSLKSVAFSALLQDVLPKAKLDVAVARCIAINGLPFRFGTVNLSKVSQLSSRNLNFSMTIIFNKYMFEQSYFPILCLILGESDGLHALLSTLLCRSAPRIKRGHVKVDSICF